MMVAMISDVVAWRNDKNWVAVNVEFKENKKLFFLQLFIVQSAFM